MFKGKTMPFALGAIFALVVGSGTAYAATGGNLILGKYNQAGATTTLKSTKGAALKLQASGSPVLKVNNGKKIAKLNADKLDGYSSEDFVRKGQIPPTPVGGTGRVSASGAAVDLSGNGIPDAVLAAAYCPTGSSLAGGGGVDATSTGYLMATAPTSDGRGWLFAVGIAELSGDTSGDTLTYVMCWGPNGKPVGTARKAPKLTAADLAMLREAQAAR